MMKKIRIAQIGTSANSHGNHAFCSLKALSDIYEVAGFCFPEGEREKFPNNMPDFEGYTELTLDEILNDKTIEAVTVETEEIYLTKYAAMAIRAGKHVHMEKPGGIRQDEFDALVREAEEKKRVLHLGYMYRYNPVIKRLLADIKAGELGDIISVEAQMNCDHTKAVREWLGTFPGGMMFFLGCHLVDLVMSIQGEPLSVTPFNKSTGKGGEVGEDFGMAVLEYPMGHSIVKASAAEIGGFARRQLVVSGTKKTVELKPLERYCEGGMFTEMTVYESADWTDNGKTERCEAFERYQPMLAAFGKTVRGEAENPYSYDYERRLHALLLKCCGYKG